MRFRSVLTLAAAALLAACGPTPAPEGPAPDADMAAGPEGRLLRVGQSLSGTLTESDPTWGSHGSFHLYRFEARAGDRLLLEMKSDEFDSYLVVGDKSGGIFNPITEDDDGGDDYDARIRFVAPRDGTFWILAQGYAEHALGTYVVSLQAQPEPGPVVVTPIGVGASIQGTIEETDALDLDQDKYYDLYSFAAQSGRRYAIEMNSVAFDTYLALGTGSADFQEISSNDDSGGETDSRIVFVPQASGEYTVRASSFDGSATGSYTLTVRELRPSGPATVTPLAFGQSVRGSLDEDDQLSDDGSYYDVYSFRGREGQRIGITMSSDQLDSYLEMGEPAAAGAQFWADHSDDDSGGNLDARIVATLSRSGEYHVHANSLYPDETGAYTITIEELPEPGPPSRQEIEIGETVNGSLDPGDAILDDGSHYDLFTFRGMAGQRLRITLRSDDFDSYLSFGPWSDGSIEVTDSDDDSGGGDSGFDSMLEITLPASGTYAIQANSLGAGELGSYTVTLDEM